MGLQSAPTGCAMTTSRMNSHGRNVFILKARRGRRASTQIDMRNTQTVTETLAAGRARAMILHPTKGYRYVNLAKPRPFVGLFDWLARVFGRIHAIKLAATLFRPALVNRMYNWDKIR